MLLETSWTEAVADFTGWTHTQGITPLAGLVRRQHHALMPQQITSQRLQLLKLETRQITVYGNNPLSAPPLRMPRSLRDSFVQANPRFTQSDDAQSLRQSQYLGGSADHNDLPRREYPSGGSHHMNQAGTTEALSFRRPQYR